MSLLHFTVYYFRFLQFELCQTLLMLLITNLARVQLQKCVIFSSLLKIEIDLFQELCLGYNGIYSFVYVVSFSLTKFFLKYRILSFECYSNIFFTILSLKFSKTAAKTCCKIIFAVP